MKSTFHNLSIEKKTKIISSCIEEFGKHGYEKGSLDRIIKTANISKGGLYEYINSKEELYLFIVDYCYSSLYDFINDHTKKQNIKTPEDILDRFQITFSIAIDFYLNNPQIIEFIVKSNNIQDDILIGKVQSVFLDKFLNRFGDISTDNLNFSKEKILDLLRWLLLKTRNDFLSDISLLKNPEEVKKAYFKDWDFLLSVLRNGIYKR
jgi:TetR/AcrR family transcriptional regulator